MIQEFCKECSNILYLKEDRDDKQLFMACKSCEHFEEAKSNIVYSIYYGRKRVPNSILSKDIVSDPTLPRVRVKCPRCDNREAVLYYGDEVVEDTAFLVYYVCSSCHEIWAADS